MRHAPPLRTYSHLAEARKLPSDYEIVSSRLLYHVDRGFEIDVPVGSWYERHQQRSTLKLSDPERFVDPRQTTYSKYTEIQTVMESHIDALLDSIEANAQDRALPADQRRLFECAVSPARFAWHGLQMAAAYLGQTAPGGRITLVALFQAADELRRVHGVARRLALSRSVYPGFGDNARTLFEEAPEWQPARRAIELCLTTYDWGEAFTALCLVLKPWLDGLLITELSRFSREHQDFFLAEMLGSFDQDCRWQRQWAGELTRMLMTEPNENKRALSEALEKWSPLAKDSVVGLANYFGESARELVHTVETSVAEWHAEIGLR